MCVAIANCAGVAAVRANNAASTLNYPENIPYLKFTGTDNSKEHNSIPVGIT